MPYSTEQCHWCGQRFIQDEEVKEFAKPLTKEVTCFSCGRKVIANVSKLYVGVCRMHREMEDILFQENIPLKKKAIKVLDMIQEAYVNGHIDYQMPADSEVVV